jgi:hypothetical protein
MAELLLGALVGVALVAMAVLLTVFGRLYEMRKARLLLESLTGAGGFDPRIVRLFADVAKRRRRLLLILALIVVGLVPIGWVIWELASS